MINKRQYMILSYFLTKVLFIGGGFSLLIGISKNNVLFSCILGTLIGYFFLYLIYKKGNINKHLCTIISISVLLINILANTTLTGTFLLYNTPSLFIILVFIVVLLYGSFKEIKIIGRVAEICIPCSIFVFVMKPIALISLTKFENTLPFFDTSFFEFIKGTLLFAGASLLPNLLLINHKENLKFKDVSIGYLIGCVGLIIIAYFIVTIYGSEFASNVRFPEYFVLKKVEFLGYISNVENILVMEWIINIVVSGLICIKTLKDNLNIYLFSTVITLIVLFNEIYLNKNYVNIIIVKNYFYYIFILLIVLSLLFKKSKNQE